MNEKPDILRIVKEDILEVLGRKNKLIPLKSMKLEVNVSHFFVSRAIKELEEEDLIKLSLEKKHWKEYIKLTKKGQDRAKDIIKKHLILEDYFKKRMSKRKAIKVTNILEHYISTEVIKNIKKLSTFKKKGVSLIEFELHKQGLIADILISESKMFERLISMGIFPGNKIILTNKISGKVVVKIEDKKFALGKNIAKKIKVLEYEKS